MGVDTTKERPVLFSAPMVKALLAGIKTQTRRVVKNPNVIGIVENGGQPGYMLCPYGAPGDRLWVKESHALIWPGADPPDDPRDNRVEYRADTDGVSPPGEWPLDQRKDPACPRWRPSIHMPRWASRLTLEVTGVRVERVQDISEEDARAEGVFAPNDHGHCWPDGQPRRAFADLWRTINGEGSWKANPFVWVVEFRRTEAP